MHEHTDFLLSLCRVLESYRELSPSDPIAVEQKEQCASALLSILAKEEVLSLSLEEKDWFINETKCETEYLQSTTSQLFELFEKARIRDLKFLKDANEASIHEVLELLLSIPSSGSGADIVLSAMEQNPSVEVIRAKGKHKSAPSVQDLLDVVLESASFDALPPLPSMNDPIFSGTGASSANQDILSLLGGDTHTSQPAKQDVEAEPELKIQSPVSLDPDRTLPTQLTSAVVSSPLNNDEQDVEESHSAHSLDPLPASEDMTLHSEESVEQAELSVVSTDSFSRDDDTFPSSASMDALPFVRPEKPKTPEGTAPQVLGVASLDSVVPETQEPESSSSPSQEDAFATVAFGDDIAKELLANSIFAEQSDSQESIVEDISIEVDAPDPSPNIEILAITPSSADNALPSEGMESISLSDGPAEPDATMAEVPTIRKQDKKVEGIAAAFETHDHELEEDKPSVSVSLSVGSMTSFQNQKTLIPSKPREESLDSLEDLQPFQSSGSSSSVSLDTGQIYTGNFEELHEFLAGLFTNQHKASGRIRNGEWRANQAATRPEVVQDASAVERSILDVLAMHSEVSQHEHVIPLVMGHLLALDVELLLLHLQALHEFGDESASWRRSLFMFLSEERHHQLQEHLYKRWLHTVEPGALETYTHLLQESVDCMFRQELVHRLIPLAIQLRKDRENLSDTVTNRIDKVLGHLAQPTYMSRLFRQVRKKKDGSAFQLLVALCRESLLYGLGQMEELSSPVARQAWVDVLVKLCQETTPQAMIPLLQEVLQELGAYSLSTQQLAFFLIQQFIPDDLEDYLCDCIPYAKSEDVREVLLQQAMVLDSRRIRKLLLHLLEHGVLAHTPQQEEWVLRYLQRVGRVEPLPFLQHRAFKVGIDVGIRCNAVWMIGSFPPEQAFPILQSLLCTEQPAGDDPAHWEAVRYLALFALSRLPLQEADAVLEQGKRSSSLLHQMASRQILRESLPSDFKDLYQ